MLTFTDKNRTDVQKTNHFLHSLIQHYVMIKDSSLFEHQRFLVHRLMRDTKELSQILHILEEIGGDCRAS